MRCYIAKCKSETFSGGWLYCLNLGFARVKEDPSLVVKIHSVRAGEPRGRVVAEITHDGVRLIRNGRHVPLRQLEVRNG